MSEPQTLEYKSSFSDAVIESITAFANSKGGSILVGVDDNGNPVLILADSMAIYISTI